MDIWGGVVLVLVLVSDIGGFGDRVEEEVDNSRLARRVEVFRIPEQMGK